MTPAFSSACSFCLWDCLHVCPPSMVGLWNCSSFLIKKNKQTYSTEPNHLKSSNSFCYNELIHYKKVGMEPAANSRGVVVIMKQISCQRKPAISSYVWTTINKNTQATLSRISTWSSRTVLPGSMHGSHLQSQHHPAQPEARDGKEEAGSPHQESLSTLTPKIIKVLADFPKKEIIIITNAAYHGKMGNFQPYVPFFSFLTSWWKCYHNSAIADSWNLIITSRNCDEEKNSHWPLLEVSTQKVLAHFGWMGWNERVTWGRGFLRGLYPLIH